MNLKKKFKNQFIVFLMFAFYVFYTLVSNFCFQISKINEYNQKICDIQKNIDSIKKNISEIKESEKQNEYDLEKIARNRLNMVKPGEIVYKDVKGR